MKPRDKAATRRHPRHWLNLEPMRYFVYTLHDSRTGVIFYVGCTTNPKERLAHHLASPRYKDKPRRLRERIADILAAGCEPVMDIVEQTEDKTREEYWMGHFNTWCPLVNVCSLREVARRQRTEYRKEFFNCGHPRTPENTSCGICKVCKSARSIKWQKEHPEAWAAICKRTLGKPSRKMKVRQYQLDHAEEIRAYQRKRYAENAEELREYQRKYYAEKRAA